MSEPRRGAARADGAGRARRRRETRSSGTGRAGSCTARERIDLLVDPDTAFLELSALAAWDVYEGQAPVCRDRHRHRRRRGPRVRGRRQRRDREGRHLLPADGEEAPARAGDRRAEPPAVHLPGRLGRRLPAAPGRGLPRPRPLRADLLQPGAHVRQGDRADRGGDGLVHRRRRLRAGDERRDGDRPRHGHDLHRRPAAREGGDGPGRDARGARRRRRAHAALGRRRPLRDERRARARDRAFDRPQPRGREAGSRRGRSPPPSRPRSIPPTSTA